MLLETIADYAVRERASRLPPEVVHHAKRAVIDWYASLLPGSRVPPATLLEQALAEELDRGRARLASGRRATTRAAALINGTAAHAVEFDDIWRDAVYHPGAPVIAAALAVGQASGAGGESFLRAVVVGYEISTRIGEAVMPSHYRYWHTTGTVGGFGAAAAAATLLGLDRAGVMNALGTVGTFAAGLQQAFRSEAMSKPLHAGRAAEAGVLAALAASRGVTGVADILEGEVGFGAATSAGADWSKATRGLGTDYRITRVTFKNHGCCGHTFAALDAVLELRRRHRLAAEDIARVRVATYQGGLDVVANPRPEGAYQAKFSLPYVVAHALVYGSVRLEAFAPERLADPRVRALMDRIELAADPELSRAFPRQRAARVEIETVDGQRLSHFQPTRKGDPELPLTDAELEDKFLELASPVLGEAPARTLLAELWALDTRGDLEPATGERIEAPVAG
jgi:2-methylcitrate dehydratase PrpD